MFLAIPPLIYNSSYAVVNRESSQATYIPCHVCQRTDPRLSDSQNVSMIRYSVTTKARYLACRCMHHPGCNTIYFLAAVQMDLSSAVHKPDFVFWLNPWASLERVSHSMERNTHQVPCKSQAAMKPTPAALDTQPWMDLYTRNMFTLLISDQFYMGQLQSPPFANHACQPIDWTTPSATEHPKQLHLVTHVNSDTNTLLPPIIHFGLWHPCLPY